MKKLFTTIFCLYGFILHAQENHLIESIYRQIEAFPQEKIYIQTDKKTYVSGEKIWCRAYLVDAAMHLPAYLSRYVYVEFTGPTGELINRFKIKPANDSTFHNSIALSENLPEGTYLIRAYTNFMRNRPDYFFEKKIFVADPQSLTLHVQPDFSFSDKRGILNLGFYDHSNEPVTVGKVSISINSDKSKKHNSEKDFSFKIDENKQQIIYLEFEHNNKLYKKYIPVPAIESDFDVSFFPEGGYIVENQRCKIGFKALNTSGLAEDITGEIFDDAGNLIISLQSAHAGMGSFLLYPETDKKYYAVCKNKAGNTKQFELPVQRTDACVLKTTWNKGNLFVNILRGEKNLHSVDSLQLIVHVRGVIIYAGKWPTNNDIVSFNRDMFPSGVIQLLLLDFRNNPLSERLIFNYNGNELAKTEIYPNKNNYNRRELVKVKVDIKDKGGIPLDGNFSVTVTDNKDILPDTVFTIVSNLFLSSDIRGYVENPGYYINNPGAADVLMLTQGWKRYNIPAVLNGSPEKPKHYLEMGQEISGTVKNLLTGKGLENNPVSIVSTAGYFGTATTGKDGKFLLNGFELPDSTKYVVQALSKKGGSGVELIIDEEPVQDVFPFIVPEFKPDSLFTEYVEKSDLNYLNEYGMRVTLLKGATVVGQKPETRVKSAYSSIMSSVVETEMIEQSRDIYILLSKIAGVMVTGKSVTIRGNTPILVIDDQIVDLEYLDMINIYDIDNIEIMKGADAALFGMRGGGGAIIIMTKRGEMNTAKTKYNVKTIIPKGYNATAEFYSPKYETKEEVENKKSDLRTTIYWKPTVIVSEGHAEFEFYTADMGTTYSVVIEGVSNEGIIIRKIDFVKAYEL